MSAGRLQGIDGVAAQSFCEHLVPAPGRRTVRTLDIGRPGAGPHVVVVPGLGALGYLLPTLRVLAERGAQATLLDLPGFGSPRPLAAPPTVQGVADVVAGYLSIRRDDRPVILVGHSTGAQAALLAALAVQTQRPVAGVVLAGPTVAPTQRRLLHLLARSPSAFRRESPRELLVLRDYARGGSDVLAMLRSAFEDRPERSIAALRARLTLTAGEADAFAPRWWLDVLAASAVRATSVRVVVEPGSHNNPFTYPEDVADVVLSAAGRRAPSSPAT